VAAATPDFSAVGSSRLDHADNQEVISDYDHRAAVGLNKIYVTLSVYFTNTVLISYIDLRAIQDLNSMKIKSIQI
jgi:hypothetical protein